MKTLAIESSSKACSCAVLDGDRLVAEGFLDIGLTHSATLMPLLAQTMELAQIALADIGRIAVAAGPGSYTGLRIGIATAKGLALPLGIPCVGVSTLLGLAYNLLPRDGAVCAVLDARVGQAFAALFDVQNGVVSRRTPDAALSWEELGTLLPDGAMAVGDGALLCAERFAARGVICAPPALRLQRAASVAMAARHLPAASAQELSPHYHRLSQAERERAAKLARKGAVL